jgi:hypothetical protein
MLRLIKPYLAAARKLHLRYGTPSFFENCGARNTLFRECCHFSLEVIAQEIEFVRAIFFGGVKCGLARRKREDQPTVSSVDGRETENVAEKGPVRVGVFRVYDRVSTRNHAALPKQAPEFPAGCEFSATSKIQSISDFKFERSRRILLLGFRIRNSCRDFCAANIFESVVGADGDRVFAGSEFLKREFVALFRRVADLADWS